MSEDLRREVQERYAAAAGGGSCCEPDFGACLYPEAEVRSVPAGAAAVSLGCGNPTAVAGLAPGEVVLDLGSGAGLDVLLAARRVGPTGFVYGLDMTMEMLELARKHAAEAVADNVAFLEGYLEDIPLEERSIDVIISNCVVNLSPDKPAVFSEMFRVLRPGGRIGISDVVAEDALSPALRLERGSWVGCVAGALSFSEYRDGLTGAGFAEVRVEAAHPVADGLHSAIISATRPAIEVNPPPSVAGLPRRPTP